MLEARKNCLSHFGEHCTADADTIKKFLMGRTVAMTVLDKTVHVDSALWTALCSSRATELMVEQVMNCLPSATKD